MIWRVILAFNEPAFKSSCQECQLQVFTKEGIAVPAHTHTYTFLRADNSIAHHLHAGLVP
jgi:hypothetical protein